MPKKLDLVLINGYGSNGQIIKGVLDTLNEYFNVHFLELPGSVENIKLDKYTAQNFVNHFQKELNKFKFEEYILGSLSLGFPLSNSLKIDKRCKGILAIEPYINKNYAHIGLLKKVFYKFLLDIICLTKIYNKIWKTKILKKALSNLGYNETIIKCILKLDAKAYFETGKIVLTYNEKPEFRKLPHVVLINEHDKMINGPKTIQTFKDNVKKLLIIKTKVPHYPDKMKKSSILHKVHKKDLNKMVNFFEENK